MTAPLPRPKARPEGSPHRFLLLLGALFLFFFIFPTIREMGLFRHWRMDFFFMLLIGGLSLAYSGSRRSRAAIAAIAVLLLLAKLLSTHFPESIRVEIPLALVLLYTLFITVIILAYVLRDGPVTAAKVHASLCVYLLIGLNFALLYGMIELGKPGSFQLPSIADTLHGTPLFEELFSHLMYFSFITLTTLGYGDVLPLNGITRNLASAEAALGQLYLAVLVARLVGLHIAHSTKSKPTG